MAKSGKSLSLVSGLMIALFALATGLAWACTPQSKIVALGIESPSAGSEIAIAGERVGAGAPVRIYWGSLEGPVLNEGIADQSGSFSSTVTLPQVPSGVYFLVMNSPATGVARTPIEVSAPGTASETSGSSAASSDLWQGYSTRSALDNSSSSTSERSSGLAAGLALTAVGATAFTATLGLAVIRRRRQAV